MQSRFRRTQHLLNALPVLEASARLGSFTRAGEELGLSQPTVSRHIANLESDLGVELFVRRHNQLTVTKHGRNLANAVDLGLSHIDGTIRKTATGSRLEGLTLACTQSFANCWLLPRFSKLRHATGHKPVHLLVSHWLEDMNPEDVDIIAHWRPQGWANWPRIHLFDEVTFPVCAPDYLARNPVLAQSDAHPSSLFQFHLLQYEERATEFVSWRDWFANLGCCYKPQEAAYRFSSYQFMLQAAQDGEGIALAWHHLVADLIAAGNLVQVGPAFRRPDAGYFLEYRDDRRTPDHLPVVLDWFRQAASGIS